MVEQALLGRTGIVVSRICIGCMQAPANRAEFIRVVHRGCDLGLNFFDTAPAYGNGESEEAVAAAIAGRRHQVVMATKFSHTASRPADLRTSLEQSLRRLGTDYVDLFQQHWPSPAFPAEDTICELERLKEEGKIRAIGVSNWMEPEWERLPDPTRIDCLQPCYSLLWRSIDAQVLPMCRRHDIAVIPYSPLAQGILLGKFDATGIRAQNRLLLQPRLAHVKRVVQALHDLASRWNKTPAQIALRWVLQQPGITSVIVGASRVEQIDENAGALGWRLEPNVLQELSEMSWPLSAGLGSRDTLWGWHPVQEMAQTANRVA